MKHIFLTYIILGCVLLIGRSVHGQNFAFEGNVVDSQTKKPIKATIYISELNGYGDMAAFQTNPISGKIESMSLLAGHKYRVYIKAKEYVPIVDTIFSENLEDIKKIYEIQHLIRGLIIRLNNVRFARGKSELLTSSYSHLQILVDIMKDNPSVKIEISGHTDSKGGPKANLKLSKERAEVIKAYLGQRHIRGLRIKTVGYGGGKPLANNSTEEGRMLNRRVEFKVI